MKEKIAIFLDYFPHSGGGYQELLYTVEKIEELNNNRIEIVIISASNNPKLPDTVLEPKEHTDTITDSIGKMQGVANALVCMFSPDTCETRKQEMAMDR